MNISFNGLIGNYYNLIKNRLFNLSPIEKKVAMVAITYLSCATLCYFIYRCYSFKAVPMGRKETEEDESPLFTPTPAKKEKGVKKENLKSYFKNDNETPSELFDSKNRVKIREEEKIDFVNSLPKEMTHAIFSHLNAEELTRCFRVNKTWKVLASHEPLWNALSPKIAFGKKQWAKYFGDIGIEPPLPKDIHKILKSPCPFFPGKKVEETHMLVLIPETIDGKPLNLTTLGELVKAPKEGHATEYRYIWDAIVKEHGNHSAAKSHWVLMTKDVIEGSRNKSYTDQQALIADLAKQTGIDYEVPNVLDAAICIFMKYISSEERLFNDNDPLTYTRCQEKTEGYQVAVGGFSPAGLGVYAAH